jgi:hypothetical protein
LKAEPWARFVAANLIFCTPAVLAVVITWMSTV